MFRPDPARSSAVTPVPAAASLTTSMSWPDRPVLASTVARAGPAGNHPLPVSPKMPTVPGRLQLAASIGTPALLNAAAVRPVGPQARPAAVLATVLTLPRWVQEVPDRLPNCTPPPLVSAITWPAAVTASASGAAARPGVSGPAGRPAGPAVAAGRERGEGQVLAGPEPGQQRPARPR